MGSHNAQILILL